ncbi:MAG: hypothetical protein ACLPX1_13440 [Steroidobacteraceae bacterium]
MHWPLVHADDLAVLYRLALEKSASGESYIGAAINGVPVGRIARAYAHRYGTRRSDPEVISANQIAAELGEWARGYALRQWQSGEKARWRLGWRPLHLDPQSEIHATEHAPRGHSTQTGKLLQRVANKVTGNGHGARQPSLIPFDRATERPARGPRGPR